LVQADVCVTGGGFTGINSAIELAERGLSVVVLEQNRIGGVRRGAMAGRSPCHCRAMVQRRANFAG